MGVHSPIVAISGILNMNLSPSFRLNHRDDLGTGIQPFCLGQHILATRKILKAHIYHHLVIEGGDRALTF